MAERRVSSRAHHPTQRLMEGRGQARGRGPAHPATSFQALGAEHAESLKGGEERGGDSSSDSDNDEVELVPSTQQQHKKKQQQQSAPAPSKALKGRRKGKWTLAAKATLATKGLQYQVWKVPGDSKNVGEKWEELYQAVQHEEPCCHLFAGMRKSALKTQLEKMVNICSSEGTQAQRESGGGTDGTEEESNETEEEKQTAADLEKTLQAIVDAKAAAAQEQKQKKQQAADKTASNTIYGVHAVSQGNSRCGPGARSTSFGEARAADEREFANLRGGGGAAAGAAGTGVTPGGLLSGRSSPTVSVSSGRSSPTVERGQSSPMLSVSSGGSTPMAEHAVQPALGGKLVVALHAPTPTEFNTHTPATMSQADLFLNKGFTYDEIDRSLAVHMLAFVLEGHHCMELFPDTVESLMRAWDGTVHAEEVEGDLVPGISHDIMVELQRHYGAQLGAAEEDQTRRWYAGGWPKSQQPTTAKFDRQAQLLAEDLLPGGVLAPVEGQRKPASHPGGPSRQAQDAQGDGNRGRKTRKNKHKSAEEKLDSFFEQQMQTVHDLNEQNRADAKAKEAGKRSFQEAQFEHDRAERKADRQHDRDLRDDERKQDRLDRAAEKAADEVRRQAERDEAAAQRNHDLEVLRLQVELAKAQNAGK